MTAIDHDPLTLAREVVRKHSARGYEAGVFTDEILARTVIDLTAERDAYREENAYLRENSARTMIDLTDLVERLEELAEDWESAVSTYDYESAMRNAAKDLREELNGDDA